MSKKEEGECCICLESVSSPNNLIVKIPCTCKLMIHQECFVQTDLSNCLVCKKKYKLDNFNISLINYLKNNNLLQKTLSISDLESDEKLEEGISMVNRHQLDIELFDNITHIEDEESSCKNLLVSLILRLVFIYLLGLIFGLIYCGLNQFTYPQLIWYLHILMNLITGSIVFSILYFCCNQVSYSLRN